MIFRRPNKKRRVKVTDRLEWIEKAGIENMKAHHACADVLAKDAGTTLTLLLAGIGGALAYATKAIDVHSWNWLSVGATVFTLWLVALSWYLVNSCLMATPIPQIYNEPKNLNVPDMEFDYLRRAELSGLQLRIEEAGSRNGLLARRLNLTRRLAVASPLIFILSSGAWWALEWISAGA
jgi:hypothetical protein